MKVRSVEVLGLCLQHLPPSKTLLPRSAYLYRQAFSLISGDYLPKGVPSTKLPSTGNPTSMSHNDHKCPHSFQFSPAAGSTHRGREEPPPIATCWGMWRPSSSQDTRVRGPQMNTGKSPQPSVLLKTVGIKSNSLPWTPANISSIVSCHRTSCFLVSHADLLIHAELFSLFRALVPLVFSA